MEASPFAGMSKYMINTRQTLVMNENVVQRTKEIGASYPTGFDIPRSAVYVPLRLRESVTTIAEAQSPTETIELLNTYFTLMFEPIAEHGEIVNQIVGDGLVAIFGAPIKRDDHREQAVLAALEMLELLKGLNHEQKLRNKVQLQMGIGIAAGNVVAGFTGTQQRAIFTCIGDAVNLASRIQEHTKIAGQPLLLDENAKQGLPATIGTQSLGPVIFKGKNNPVTVYAILPKI